jgi:hypothetical protein
VVGSIQTTTAISDGTQIIGYETNQHNIRNATDIGNLTRHIMRQAATQPLATNTTNPLASRAATTQLPPSSRLPTTPFSNSLFSSTRPTPTPTTTTTTTTPPQASNDDASTTSSTTTTSTTTVITRTSVDETGQSHTTTTTRTTGDGPEATTITSQIDNDSATSSAATSANTAANEENR